MAAVHHVLDDYFLAITFLVTLGYQLLGFSIAYTLQFDKLTDFAGGTNFIILSILTLSLSSIHTTRQILASLFLILWAARLSGFLLFRIIQTGSDTRFDGMRDKFFSFLGFWIFQIVWVWSVSLPVTIANSNAVTVPFDSPSFGTPADIVGVIMWSVGFTLEAVSDMQKYRFRSNPTNKGRTCDTGLFAWSRHPNYFGEILCQFGIFTLTISPSAYGYISPSNGAYAAQYSTILGPIFLTVLLLFVSGLKLQERPGAKKRYESDGPEGPNWLQHAKWLEETSILFPLPPGLGLWRRLPTWIKRSVGCEWPIYVFVPERDADLGKVASRRGGEGDVGEEEGEGRGGIESGRERGESQDGLARNGA